MTLTVRASTTSDLEALLAFTTSEPVAWTGPDRYRDEAATRNHRPEWSWLALRDGIPVGRAIWWGASDADVPATLDDVLVTGARDEQDRITIAAGLLRAGAASFGTVREWIVDVAVDWRDDPAAVAAVRWRSEAASAAGLPRTTERISVAWTPDAGLPAPGHDLSFRSGDDDEFLDLFARVTVGSLDDHTRATVERLGARATAADDLEFYASLPGRREDWRIAVGTDGVTRGFVLATRTAYDAAVSYIGVLPQHRGNGVVDALLAEALRVHHAAGEARVVGTTDAANTPMWQAFERAGFRVTKRRIVFDR
jgi:ribosomal protein S18 acetylase RimI-like enzyme